MTAERAEEIGQAMLTGKGAGPANTQEAGEAAALLWGRLNQARRVIEDLRDELDDREWTFQDGGWKGGEGVECYGCGARGPCGTPPPHRLTCGWKQAMDATNTFLGVEDQNPDSPKEEVPGDRGQRQDVPVDGQESGTQGGRPGPAHS